MFVSKPKTKLVVFYIGGIGLNEVS